MAGSIFTIAGFILMALAIFVFVKKKNEKNESIKNQICVQQKSTCNESTDVHSAENAEQLIRALEDSMIKQPEAFQERKRITNNHIDECIGFFERRCISVSKKKRTLEVEMIDCIEKMYHFFLKEARSGLGYELTEQLCEYAKAPLSLIELPFIPSKATREEYYELMTQGKISEKYEHSVKVVPYQTEEVHMVFETKEEKTEIKYRDIGIRIFLVSKKFKNRLFAKKTKDDETWYRLTVLKYYVQAYVTEEEKLSSWNDIVAEYSSKASECQMLIQEENKIMGELEKWRDLKNNKDTVLHL